MASTQAAAVRQEPRWGLAAVTALGIVVAAVLAAYSRVHPGNGAAIVTFGFRTLLSMKTWLTTAALIFLVVQVISASGHVGSAARGQRFARHGRARCTGGRAWWRSC